MGRKTVRTLSRSPSAPHILAKRDAAGSVQFTGLTTANPAGSATSGSPVTQTTTLGPPQEILFDQIKAKATGMTAGQKGTVLLKHDGNAVASTSGSGTTTLSTTYTEDTPVVVETATVELQVTAGSSDLTITTWSREQRV